MREERPGIGKALERLRHEVDLFCSSADLDVAAPDRTEALGQSLREQRRIINLLELRFAKTVGHFAAPYQTENADAGLPEMDAVDFMRSECNMTAHAATAAKNIANHQARLAGSIAALQDGSIGMAHLTWMASTAEILESSCTRETSFDETSLLKKAKQLGVQKFRRHCEHFIHRNDREGFNESQAATTELRRLRLSTYGDGSVRLDGVLDPEGGATLLAALTPYADRHGPDDYRKVAQRNADALVEACNVLLDSGRVPQRGGGRPHIHVTTTLETLMDACDAPAGEFENGTLLSGDGVRRLACDATMVRVLLNSESMVIDVGRARRVVPAATRRALNIRDAGCVWPGCERSASRTQAHHLLHWADGGLTDLDNLVSLCRRHHWMVHDGGHVIVRTDNGEILTFAREPGYFPRGREPDSRAA